MQEAALKKLTRERDVAISQLGVAYLDSQQLKEENQALKREIAELKSGAMRGGAANRKNKDEDTRRTEQTDATEEDSLDDSEVLTRRTADTSRSTKDLTSRSARSRSKPQQEKSSAKISSQVDDELYRLDKERAEEALFSLDLSRPRRPSALPETSSDSQPRPSTGKADKKPNTGKQRKKRVIVEEVDVSEPVDVTTDDATGHSRKSAQTEEDVTMLSFMDPREIAELRKTLEQERIARKHRQPEETTGPELSTSARQSKNSTALPRKSSLKESRAAPPRPTSATGDFTSATRGHDFDDEAKLSVPNERRRRHSDQSIPAISERRRRRFTDDMTSAYLVPDITLRYADVVAGDGPGKAQNIANGVANHDGKNCTVCRRLVSDNSPCEHMHEPLKVPKPIPVSQRMPEQSAYNEDPTLRPAQPPAVALATVLKALEDELSHLKMQLAACQASYNRLDASLSKRRRKAMHEKIEKLFTEIDVKSDQIYALYDVLEGQKQAGQEMTEAEMEVTLQSIGINIPAMGATDVTGNTDKSFERKVGVDYDVDGDEEELPWEGFESTGDMTGRTSNSHRN